MEGTNANHSKPIKEGYSSDINDSRQEEKKDLLYEFIDDYTYEDSKHCLFHIRKYKQKTYLYASMENGPKDMNTLNKLVTWKVSGANSNREKGHKGGGNCRFIYGHNTDKVILNSMLDADNFIRLETNPDKINEHSNSPTMNEETFQKVVDRDCIKWSTDILDYDEDGSWFKIYREEIKHKMDLEVNYVIRFNLTEVDKDYQEKDRFEYFKIRMKYYKIPIYFKNELVGDKAFKENIKLDLIGEDHKVENTTKILKLLIDSQENYFIQYDNEIRDSNNLIITNKGDMKEIATLTCYQIDKTHFKKELSSLNKIGKSFRNYDQETFYGIWIKMNEKTTDYIAIPNILIPSKNYKDGGNSQFRIVIEPSCNSELNSFIVTDTIKSKTTFRDINKSKSILKIAQKIYAKEPPKTPKSSKKKKPVKKDPTAPKIKGGLYLGYIGNNLWKYGLVEDYERLNNRLSEIKYDSINKIREFYEKEMVTKNFILYLGMKVDDSDLLEKQVQSELKNHPDQIALFEHHNGNNSREYFECTEHDYIIHKLIPKIKSLNNV